MNNKDKSKHKSNNKDITNKEKLINKNNNNFINKINNSREYIDFNINKEIINIITNKKHILIKNYI